MKFQWALIKEFVPLNLSFSFKDHFSGCNFRLHNLQEMEKRHMVSVGQRHFNVRLQKLYNTFQWPIFYLDEGRKSNYFLIWIKPIRPAWLISIRGKWQKFILRFWWTDPFKQIQGSVIQKDCMYLLRQQETLLWTTVSANATLQVSNQVILVHLNIL